MTGFTLKFSNLLVQGQEPPVSYDMGLPLTTIQKRVVVTIMKKNALIRICGLWHAEQRLYH